MIASHESPHGITDRSDAVSNMSAEVAGIAPLQYSAERDLRQTAQASRTLLLHDGHSGVGSSMGENAELEDPHSDERNSNLKDVGQSFY